jgi:pimeloyl-ACP methyl ester carboxylesterase
VANLFEPWPFWPALFSAFEPAPGVPPPFATLDSVLLELPTMELRVRAADRGRKGVPVLIVAPFALHDAAIADFAPGFSLAAVLEAAGPVALTRWRSATQDLRLLTIDSYLAELNVAVDELGGRVALVGLCQGGWLAALYAARFAGKAAALVLAGAPIDLAAAPSQILEHVAATPTVLLQSYLAAFGGLAPGALPQSIASAGISNTPGFMALFSTHPPIEERISALRDAR